MIKTFLKKLKRFLLLKTTHRHLRIDTTVPHTYIGGEYGGFYVADSLSANPYPVVYSCGIGEDVTFDRGMISKFNARIFAYDPTPRSIEFINSIGLGEQFIFQPLAIASNEGFMIFQLPVNQNHVSGSLERHSNVDVNSEIKVKAIKLSSALSYNGHQNIDVLKLDIEGSEYDVIEDWLNDTSGNATQVLVEIHDRFFRNGIKKSRIMTSALRAHGYKLFAVSSNLEELSFVKNFKTPFEEN